jgi:hypothetical protein
VLAHHLPVDAAIVHRLATSRRPSRMKRTNMANLVFGNETLLEGEPFVNVYSLSHLA